MRINTKMFFCIIVIVLSLGTVSLSVYLGLKNLSENIENIELQYAPISELAADLHISMLTHRRYEKDILLNSGSTNKQENYLKNFNLENKKIMELLEKILVLVNMDTSIPSNVKDSAFSIKENLNVYINGVTGIAQNIMENPSTSPQEANRQLEEFKDATYLTENAIETILTYSKESMNTALKLQNKLSKNIINIIRIVLLVGGVITLLAIILTITSIAKPLQRVIAFADNLKQGKFDVPPSGRFFAEMHDLVQTLTLMSQNLQSEMTIARKGTEDALVAQETAQQAQTTAEHALNKAEHAKKDGLNTAAIQLESVVEGISNISGSLSEYIAHSEKRTSLQTEQVNETTHIIANMNVGLLEMANSASSATQVSGDTRQKAESGSDIVQQSLDSIQSVKKQAEALRGDMADLRDNTKNITQIIGVISDIADQTNLLALNAAIEAARAGDSGRGFAVVADEVRKLAEKTIQSTSDVGNVIAAIQKSADNSMIQVDKTVNIIADATDLSEQSGESLKEIVQLVDDTAEQVRFITVASDKQSASSKQVNTAVDQVSTLAKETSWAMTEAAKMVAELSEQVHSLVNIIGKLKSQ